MIKELDGRISRHFNSFMTAQSADGVDVSLQSAVYRFQKGVTQMLVEKYV